MELNKILEELQKYKTNDRSQVLANRVQERLNNSLKTYYEELSKSLNYLYARNDLKVIKKLNDD